MIRKQSEPHGHADFLVLLRRLLYDENQNSLTLRQLIFAIRYARKICGNPAVSVQLSSVFFYHLVYRECKSIGCFLYNATTNSVIEWPLLSARRHGKGQSDCVLIICLKLALAIRFLMLFLFRNHSRTKAHQYRLL